MNEGQRRAINIEMTDLCDALSVSVPVFSTYLIREGIISLLEKEFIETSNLSMEKIILLLKMLQYKDRGWSSLIRFLRNHGLRRLSDTLQQLAIEYEVNESSIFESTKLVEEFSLAVAKYYQSTYSKFRTLWDNSKNVSFKNVKDTWVDLPLEKEGQEPSDCSQLLTSLKNSDSYFAIIKGEPGAGKTLLVKKIASDWATARLKNPITQHLFTVVLAVPLREVEDCEDFLSAAVDFFLKKLGQDRFARNILKEKLNELKLKLLICFDGLDEYRCYGESPFKCLFAAPFEKTAQKIQSLPPEAKYKLLVTSRPYACALINENFFPLQFRILTLDPNHTEKFCQLYCRTPDGIKKVMRFLVTTTELLVPLILTFVCFLAESDEKIPDNLSLLYHRFVYHMIKREREADKMVEKIELNSPTSTNLWLSSDVIKSTAKLAFLGCKESLLEFSLEDMKTAQITDDSFICGFLLSKYDFNQGCPMAEFPHKSFQEFFGALHCCHLLFTGSQTERNFVIAEMSGPNNQLGRFLFGICSIEQKFEPLVDWLKISPDEAKMLMSKFYILFQKPLGALFDCSNEEKAEFNRKIWTLSSS